MKRLLMDELISWKSKKKRKPLIIWGARQVGKTWLMKEFGRTNYDQTAYITFYRNKAMQDTFAGSADIGRLIKSMEIESGVSITPGNTLIVLDEIQECPAALDALKYFAEDAAEYHVVAAGSQLGIAMHEGVSFPVGKVDELTLYPMNFREFLYAMGENRLCEALGDKRFVSDMRERAIQLLKSYYYIGGMPEVVAGFAEDQDYAAARRLQESLLHQYEEDFSKHVPAKDLAKVRLVWNAVPVQLAKENRKFFFGRVKEGARLKDLEDAIDWLVSYGLVYKVNKVSKPAVPLKSYAEVGVFKLFMFDCGLAAAMSELDARSLLDGNSVFTEFKGALTEEYVLTQIVSDTNYTPYYYAGDKGHFETDFVISKDGDVVPVEVKAETNLKSKSLRMYYDKFTPAKAYRISMADYQDQGWVVNVPLYAIHDYL